MASLYISEYQGLLVGQGGAVQAPYGWLANQKLVIGASPHTTGLSAAFNAKTSVIRVHADAIASVLIAADPTAATTDARMAAGQTEYFGVDSGQKLSCITNS